MDQISQIPVTVITGFLGSGKTTLLSSILKKKELQKTAVIINEFGEIGLDHALIEHTDENIVELQSGCICCTIQGHTTWPGIGVDKTVDKYVRRETNQSSRDLIILLVYF